MVALGATLSESLTFRLSHKKRLWIYVTIDDIDTEIIAMHYGIV